jgi:putative tryptophan/tyrosine transport system substrate-binding protein
MPDTFTTGHRSEITSLAARYRLPAVYPWRFFAEQGGLLSCGSEQGDLFRRAATYVDRILKGEKPVHLPVQAATEYRLVINLKTAKALGLTVLLTYLTAPTSCSNETRCPLLAHSGHAWLHCKCLLLG